MNHIETFRSILNRFETFLGSVRCEGPAGHLFPAGFAHTICMKEAPIEKSRGNQEGEGGRSSF